MDETFVIEDYDGCNLWVGLDHNDEPFYASHSDVMDFANRIQRTMMVGYADYFHFRNGARMVRDLKGTGHAETARRVGWEDLADYIASLDSSNQS